MDRTGLCRHDEEGVRALPDDLDAMTLYGDALFLLEPRRGTRDLNAEHQAAAQRAGERAGAGHQAPRRLPPLRPRHRIDRRTRQGSGVRRVPRQRRAGRESHEPHAVAHLERDRPLERRRARQPPGLALGPQGRHRRGLRHLSRPQPAHAALRRLQRQPGRDRRPGREGLRQEHWRHDVSRAHAAALRPLRRDPRGDQAPRARGQRRVLGLRAGLRRLRAGEVDFARLYLSRVKQPSRPRSRHSATTRPRRCSAWPRGSSRARSADRRRKDGRARRLRAGGGGR